jgi:sugar-phosphatase
MNDPSATTFRAAIFDMDGLLLDSEPFWQEAERDALAAVGVHLDDADLCQTIGMRIDEVASYWFARRPWDCAAHPEAAVVEAVVLRVIELVKAHATPLPGVVATVDLLQREGLDLAVASSSPLRIILPALAALGLRDRFSVVTSAEHEPQGKPDPAVYLTALRKLGVAAECCFALEDSVAGLGAAQAAGLKCVAVPEPRLRARPEWERADLVLESLESFDHATLQALAR